jgi:hypothetical protein
MSTVLSQGRQFTVHNEEQILNECIKANFIDCRINAYPILSVDDAVAGIQAPNIIFIDVDITNDFGYEEVLDQLSKILKQTLSNIKKKLNGCIPTVVWTGNGYHIYIVLDARPLELITDLTELSKDPSKEFLKFGEIILTNRKADTKHNHSFNSYLMRIPYTFNSKCLSQDKRNAEVKVVQRVDTSTVPAIDANLLREFRLYLVDLDIRNKAEATKNTNNFQYTTNTIPQTYLWIETLLQTPIPDHRKHTLELVLAPYLIIIKHQSYDGAYSTIKRWVLKCNVLRALKPSLNNFLDYRTRVAIDKSVQKGIPPIRIETIMENYPVWYDDFRQYHLFDKLFNK